MNFEHYKMSYLYDHKLEISALTDEGYSNEIELNTWKTPKTIPANFMFTNFAFNVKFEMQYTAQITDADLGFQMRFWCDGKYSGMNTNMEHFWEGANEENPIECPFCLGIYIYFNDF